MIPLKITAKYRIGSDPYLRGAGSEHHLQGQPQQHQAAHLVDDEGFGLEPGQQQIVPRDD
ncbi:hypothetical protein CF141_08680 [Aeromonas hydrophila]|nr:hypothetical protein CF141_08680 [Aeromonas hydrophila]